MLGYTASMYPVAGLSYRFQLQLVASNALGADRRTVVERQVDLVQADDLEMTFLGLLAEGIGVALTQRRSS